MMTTERLEEIRRALERGSEFEASWPEARALLAEVDHLRELLADVWSIRIGSGDFAGAYRTRDATWRTWTAELSPPRAFATLEEAHSYAKAEHERLDALETNLAAEEAKP